MFDFLKRFRWLLVLPLATAIGGVALAMGPPPGLEQASAAPTTPPEIVVDIEGAVARPGVRRVPEGSLVEDAINAAGGLTEHADLERVARDLNRAEKLRPHQKIVIPRVGGQSSPASGDGEGRINLNEATAEELEKLPGIGPSIAKRIIEYREQNGPFSAPEELQNISGISDKRFAELQDLVTV